VSSESASCWSGESVTNREETEDGRRAIMDIGGSLGVGFNARSTCTEVGHI
jgi:hypothetical protein